VAFTQAELVAARRNPLRQTIEFQTVLKAATRACRDSDHPERGALRFLRVGVVHYEFSRQNPRGRRLDLDNHPIFGGHPKQNELKVDG